MKKFYLIALVMAGLATLFAGLVEVAVQQDMRQSANDPQIQIAQDVAAALSSGAKPDAIVPAIKVDISQSLAPYVIIYNDKEDVVAGNAVLDGAAPKIPAGILEYVKNSGEDRVTWQPRADVRSAIIVDRFQSSELSGFVVVGRSLREVEKRESKLEQQVIVAWAASLVVIIGGLILGKFVTSEKK